MMRGLLIAFEGKDKCGKTTQAKLLIKNFQLINIKAEYIAFPKRDTEIGQLLDKYLKKQITFSPETAQLLFAANRREMQKYILDTLNNNIHVILDRYYLSGLVYSKALGINIEADKGIIKPDVTILLNYQYKQMQNEEIYESDDFQNKLNFNTFISDYNEENSSNSPYILYDQYYDMHELNDNILLKIIEKNNIIKEISYL